MHLFLATTVVLSLISATCAASTSDNAYSSGGLRRGKKSSSLAAASKSWGDDHPSKHSVLAIDLKEELNSVAEADALSGAPSSPIWMHHEHLQNNIAKRINIGMLNGINQFAIEAEEEDTENTNISTRITRTATLHLTRMTPAVTPSTVIQFAPSRDRHEGHFNSNFIENLVTLTSYDTTLQIDVKTGNMRGIQHSSHGRTKQIFMNNNALTDAKLQMREVKSVTGRKFSCGVNHDDKGDHLHHHHEHSHEEEAPWGSVAAGTSPNANEEGTISVERHGQENRKLGEHVHSIEHKHPAALRGLRGNHEHSHSSNLGNLSPRNLISNQEHKFQINVLIAIDAEFISHHGGSQSEAIQYINFLVSSTNEVLHREIDAHLNVIKVEEVNIFDETAHVYRPGGGGPKRATDSSDGLDILQKYYEGTVGTSINGQKINLVHGLIGQELGGGIAYIDSVCDSRWGVGFSSGLRGSMLNLNADTYSDSHMVTHEIGHSLGTGHTFDVKIFDPPIDTCGVSWCPSGVKDGTSTIMSYCKFCDGGLDNVAMTFGGVWDGIGPQSDISSWGKSPLLASYEVSKDPQRVSHLIWNTLESKGSCIQQHLRPIQAPTTNAPSPLPTELPTTSSPSVLSPTTKAPNYFLDTPEDDRLIWTHLDEHYTSCTRRNAYQCHHIEQLCHRLGLYVRLVR